MLLRVSELRTTFDTPAGPVHAVDGVSFEIPRGHTLALVGESGCGKSLTALSILRLVPPPGRVREGSVLFDGRELLSLSPREMRAVRGNQIAMIFQEPMTSLNPLLTVGAQVDEALRLHRGLSARATRAQTIELLRRVGIPAPAERAVEFAHQLSGGMRQRVLIAAALACEPALLIADEPTTALDVTVQAQILALIQDLQRASGMALLFITHDLAVVAQIADSVCVMYAGRIVERAAAAELFADPRHPYTRALLRSTPRMGSSGGESGASINEPGGRRLPVIPGDVPDALHRPTGCAFHPRCELGREDERCRIEIQTLRERQDGRVCACWKAGSA